MKKVISKLIFVCAALMISLSCSQEGVKGDNELISANPAELSAPATLNQQTVNVESNCTWDLSVVGEDGAEPAWLTAGKKSGNGNAKVTFKVDANKFKERKATLTFTTKGGKTSSVILTQAGETSSAAEFIEQEIRVGTFNLRRSGMTETDERNSWKNRKEKVKTAIKTNDFDIFGVQEVDTEQQTYLKTAVGDIYDMKFFSPYAQDGNGSRAQGLLYKKSEYTLSDWKYFWPSDDPFTMSKNDKDSQTTYSRGACFGILTHKVSGAKVFVMVMHGFLDDPTADKWAYMNNDMEKEYNPEGYPAFFVGDLNAEPTRNAYKTWAGYWKDTYTTAKDKSGPAGTFNGWKTSTATSRIDYIFYKGNAEPKNYVCDDTMIEGTYPSDHFPVRADFIVRSKAK